MAFDQDMLALRTLTHVLAVELGEHDSVPHIEKATIAEDLVTALPIAPLLKMNVLRFVPRASSSYLRMLVALSSRRPEAKRWSAIGPQIESAT